MASRFLPWIAAAAVVAGVLIYFLPGGDDPAPGQPAPHAIDQSQ